MAREFAQVWAGEATEETVVPVLVMNVTYKTAILHVAAGWDYMPGHHEPAYAIAQGTENIYLNTLFHQSLVDRTVIDWAGPLTFMTRRKISMRDQIYPGDRLEGHAKIVKAYRDDAGRALIDLTVVLRTPRADACVGEVTIRLPERAAT